jgi:GNAT superfamily N-acetyltransferase
MMNSQESGPDEHSPSVIIRSSASEDADGITRVYLESAEHHARLDPARYGIPSSAAIAARYRDGQQHPLQSAAEAITLVAELNNEIVGFLDARLDRSPDPMHKHLLYCVIVEIAVSRGHQSRGIGGRLLEAAEAWGREHGANFSSLEYLAENARAAEFYCRRMGYRAAHITAIKSL